MRDPKQASGLHIIIGTSHLRHKELSAWARCLHHPGHLSEVIPRDDTYFSHSSALSLHTFLIRLFYHHRQLYVLLERE